MKGLVENSPHFAEEQWCDFVRQAVSPTDRDKMQRHLTSGCVPCAQKANWLSVVAQSAGRDADEVPAHLVAAAKNIFEPQPAGPSWSDTLRQLPARLIWAEQMDFQAFGLRGPVASTKPARQGPASQRMLFRAGEYAVDLSCEWNLSGGGEFVGQIINEGSAEELAGILVQVIATGRTVAETATNRFGEFIIGVSARKRCDLRLALPDRKRRIDIPMPTLRISNWQGPKPGSKGTR